MSAEHSWPRSAPQPGHTVVNRSNAILDSSSRAVVPAVRQIRTRCCGSHPSGNRRSVSGPMDSPATSVPATVGAQLVLVEGRSFAISDTAGQMMSGTHGLVHDDLRHLSEL